MKIWGIHKTYQTMNWWENFMGGHISIANITIYGANAMCWTVNIYTKKWGYICFTLPSISRFRRKVGHHFYLSPNGTPWACTYYRGADKKEVIKAQIRKMNFGHNFSTNDEETYQKLRCLNEKFEWFEITDYDMHKFGYPK